MSSIIMIESFLEIEASEENLFLLCANMFVDGDGSYKKLSILFTKCILELVKISLRYP